VKTRSGAVANSHKRLLLITIEIVVAAIVLVSGCSRTGEPEALGTISLDLQVESAADGGPSALPAQVSPDSVVVRVFRGGNGVTLEVSRGVALDGTGLANVTVACIAEDNKKVSVELFENRTMWYFGVDEHVDVVVNEQTDVLIDAYDMRIDNIDVTPQVVLEGTSYNVSWSDAVAATSYLLLESTRPDFDEASTQTFLTTATEMTFERSNGAYYYMVAPVNPYAVGTMAGAAYSYVQAVGEPAPAVSSVDPPEAAPGDLVTLYGTNLDLPGSRVYLGAALCPVVSAEDRQMTVRIPLFAQTGVMSLYTVLGTVDPGLNGDFVVDRIAYVTRTGEFGLGYRELVEKDGTVSSGVAIVPLSEVSSRSMSAFDIIVVAHDVATGPTGPGQAAVQAIAESGAQVLAIGAGGHAYLSLLFPEINGYSSTLDVHSSVYIANGTFPVFQAPYSIAPQGPATVDVCVTDQPFLGIDISGIILPSFISLYAAHSELNSQSYVLVGAESAVDQSVVQNLYWGFEGDPGELSSLGRDCVINFVHFLLDQKISA
jgi:hypothetical protein